MGTRFELVLLDPGERLGPAALRAAGEAALDVIRDTEARWSLFRKTSRLAELNRSGHRKPLRLDLDDLDLFETIACVHTASCGAFDPNVATAMQSAGHFAAADRTAQLGAPGTGTWVFDREAREVRFTGPGPALDLGGVAKGHALDLAARELAASGVTCALLHGGTSSVLALETSPYTAELGDNPWLLRVGALDVELLGRALAASGSDSQVTKAGGHLRIPGAAERCVPPGRHAAVTAPSAALADAWATALCVDPALRVSAADALALQGVAVLGPVFSEPATHEPRTNSPTPQGALG